MPAHGDWEALDAGDSSGADTLDHEDDFSYSGDGTGYDFVVASSVREPVPFAQALLIVLALLPAEMSLNIAGLP